MQYFYFTQKNLKPSYFLVLSMVGCNQLFLNVPNIYITPFLEVFQLGAFSFFKQLNYCRKSHFRAGRGALASERQAFQIIQLPERNNVQNTLNKNAAEAQDLMLQHLLGFFCNDQAWKLLVHFDSTTYSIDNSACPASLWSEQNMHNIFILLLQFLIQTSVDKCMACTLCDLQVWN